MMAASFVLLCHRNAGHDLKYLSQTSVVPMQNTFLSVECSELSPATLISGGHNQQLHVHVGSICEHLIGAGVGCSAGTNAGTAAGASSGELAGEADGIRYDSDSSGAAPDSGDPADLIEDSYAACSIGVAAGDASGGLQTAVDESSAESAVSGVGAGALAG